jgi:uncharacterized protein (TIGR02466 family)
MIITLFPKIIYVESLKSLTPDITQYLKDKMLASSIAASETNGEYTSEQNLLEDKTLAELTAEITLHVQEYIKHLGHKVNLVRICNSWGNIIKYGNEIENHNHANSYISGCFYLTDGCNISFHNSKVNNDFMFLPEVISSEDKPWTWGSTNIPAQAGRLILFPSMLFHSVEKNKLSDRYSIAFNCIPTGFLGTPTGQLQL